MRSSANAFIPSSLNPCNIFFKSSASIPAAVVPFGTPVPVPVPVPFPAVTSGFLAKVFVMTLAGAVVLAGVFAGV